nr:hypothetical protein [Gordonia sp. X0973]
MSPSPRRIHQRVVARLHLTLDAARPPWVEVLFAPFGVVLADDTVIQPDLLVLSRESRSTTKPLGVRRSLPSKCCRCRRGVLISC